MASSRRCRLRNGALLFLGQQSQQRAAQTVVTMDVLYDHSEGTPSFPGGHLWYCRNKILLRPKSVFSKSCHPSNKALRHRFHSSQHTLADVKHYLHYSGVAPISRLQQSWLQGPAFTAIGENRFYRCRQEAGSDSSGGGWNSIHWPCHSEPSKQASKHLTHLIS